jgi:hypothetical protein
MAERHAFFFRTWQAAEIALMFEDAWRVGSSAERAWNVMETDCGGGEQHGDQHGDQRRYV